MRKLISVEKQTDNKYLNLYHLKYVDNGKNINYYFASRREYEEIGTFNQNKVDAVRAIPYLYKNNKLYVVLIKEFRHVINNFIYSVPAGLIDGNETYEEAIVRELKEEIGAVCLNVECTHNPSFISVGMSDEKIVCFECEVELGLKQKLDENEEIEIMTIAFDELENFIKNNNFDLQSELQLSEFIYKYKLKNLKNN